MRGGEAKKRLTKSGGTSRLSPRSEAKNLTHDVSYAAKQLRFLREEYTITTKILRAAIEAAKQANAFEGNPDVWIDISNGNLYLEEEGEGYEFLDNVDYYLP